MNKTEIKQELKYPIYILIGIAAIFLIFTRDIVVFFRFFLAFVAVIYLPGYALATWLMGKWSSTERAISAIVLGMGPGPLVAYGLGLLHIKAINAVFVIIFAILSGVAIWYKFKKK